MKQGDGGKSTRRQTHVFRAPCHTRKVTDLSNSHNVHGGARSRMKPARPTFRCTDVGVRSIAVLVAGTVSAGHDAVVPTQGCIIRCPEGQSCSPAITGIDTELFTWDGPAIEAWPPLIDVDIDIGVTECIDSTPKTVKTISKPAAEVGPRRRCGFAECMPPTIQEVPPRGTTVSCFDHE